MLIYLTEKENSQNSFIMPCSHQNNKGKKKKLRITFQRIPCNLIILLGLILKIKTCFCAIRKIFRRKHSSPISSGSNIFQKGVSVFSLQRNIYHFQSRPIYSKPHCKIIPWHFQFPVYLGGESLHSPYVSSFSMEITHFTDNWDSYVC